MDSDREKDKPCHREGTICWKDGSDCQFMAGYKCQHGVQYLNGFFKSTKEIAEAVGVAKSIQESTAIIRQNENLVGLGLWNIGNELKYIRDNKTYKAVGINSFEEYCEQHLKYGRRHVYKIIEISETYSVPSMAQIGNLGVTKLLALAKLDEPDREAFVENNNVSEMTTREVEAKVKARLEEQYKAELAEKESKYKTEIEQLQKEKNEEQRKADLKYWELMGKKTTELELAKKNYEEGATNNRSRIKSLYEEIEALKAAEPKVVEKPVIPDDYEELKKLKSEQETKAKEIAAKERELAKKENELTEEKMKFLNNRFDRDKILGFRNKLEKANGLISEEIGKLVMLHFEIEDKSKLDENLKKFISEIESYTKKIEGLITVRNDDNCIIEGEVLN